MRGENKERIRRDLKLVKGDAHYGGERFMRVLCALRKKGHLLSLLLQRINLYDTRQRQISPMVARK